MRSLHFAVGSAPVEAAVSGAARYQTMQGRPVEHPGQYAHTVIGQSITNKVADAYMRLPDFDRNALPAFHQMREEVKAQFEHLTAPKHKGGMGVDVQVTPHDPYGAAGGEFSDKPDWTKVVPEMRHDFEHNRRLQVFSTAQTGGHAVFNNDENDMFRAVHDVFGHLGTGRGIDKHGEEAAFQKHARMFSPLARRAMATETRGQNSALHATGSFQDQKVALLPEHLARGGIIHTSKARERAQAVLQARQFNVRQGIGG